MFTDMKKKKTKANAFQLVDTGVGVGGGKVKGYQVRKQVHSYDGKNDFS